MAGFQHFRKKSIGKGLGDTRNRLIQGTLQLIMTGFGGLEGLIQAFRQHGQSAIIDSWVSEDQNAAVSRDQLESVLGPERIADIAVYAQIPEDEVRNRLPDLLPELVDRLTPDGHVPENPVLDRALKLVISRLNREPGA